MTIQKAVRRSLVGIGILAFTVWACVVVAQKYSTAAAGTLSISAPVQVQNQSSPPNLADRLQLERLMAVPR